MMEHLVREWQKYGYPITQNSSGPEAPGKLGYPPTQTTHGRRMAAADRGAREMCLFFQGILIK